MLSNSLPSHLDSDHTYRALMLSVNSKVYHIQRLFPQSSLLQNLLWCQTLSAEFSNLNREWFLYFSWTPPPQSWSNPADSISSLWFVPSFTLMPPSSCSHPLANSSFISFLLNPGLDHSGCFSWPSLNYHYLPWCNIPPSSLFADDTQLYLSKHTSSSSPT